ncbi:MAG: cardiolipin synthase [Planctomycetota bacterium]
MNDSTWFGLLFITLELILCIGLSFRIVMRRLPESTSLAWVLVVLVFPGVGIILYLLFGELRLGHWRLRRAHQTSEQMRSWRDELVAGNKVYLESISSGQEIARAAMSTFESPVIGGNHVELLHEWSLVASRLIQDINQARHHCHLEFYIWSEGGFVTEIEEALIRAAGRGVQCRMLVDAVGGQQFLRSPRAKQLQIAGIEVRTALPAGLIRALFARVDLRMHRKIIVIDDAIGYTGSLNMADPRYFKKEANVGAWVDAMMRVEGPAVEPLSMTFLGDWAQEGKEVPPSRQAITPGSVCGTCSVQVIPSGPTMQKHELERLLLTAIFSARREIVLTTPYFVPNTFLLGALLCAVDRGVDVTLIVPTRIDSWLVRHATRVFQGDLQAVGVKVRHFDAGLLHTKSITIDGEVSLFGSVNLDPRSFLLNFEITLAIYSRKVTTELRELQEQYLLNSHAPDLSQWQRRGTTQRFIENLARLVGPLL